MDETLPDNPHFATAETWEEAATMLSFEPRVPRDTLGLELTSLRIHVRDHRRRDLRVEDRTLEAHYGAFVVSQAWKGDGEARRWALEVGFGPAPRPVRVAGREGRLYERGPEPPPDDIDGRMPAVVTWHDGGRFYLVASGELEAETLHRIAASLYR